MEHPGKWRQPARYCLLIHPPPNSWSTMRKPVELSDPWRFLPPWSFYSGEETGRWGKYLAEQGGSLTHPVLAARFPLSFPSQGHQRPRQPWSHRSLGRVCSFFRLGIKYYLCLSLYFLFSSSHFDSDLASEKWASAVCSLLIASLPAGSFSLSIFWARLTT